MSNCSEGCTRSSCEGCPSRENASFAEPMNKESNIHHVIGIVSGKGGVGKSSTTALLAVYLRQQGYRVGILDADITGPSIPKMFGATTIPGVIGENMVPAETETGIKVISINLLLENEDEPVIWRGPVLAGVVKQFWNQVNWGSRDIMFIDMPPGTGDVPLTVFQSLHVDGVVIVTSPQQLVGLIVEKAVNMAKMMEIPVVGIVENMSYFECPKCGERHAVLGESNVEEVANRHGIPVVCKLPIAPLYASAADAGKVDELDASPLAPLLG